MPAIVTLTLNPALDITTRTPRVEPTSKLRCVLPQHEPGGGGINVARVVRLLGGDSLAVYPAGGLFGERLSLALDMQQVPQRIVPIAGETRESFTIDETETGQQYRFVLPGPELAPAELDACLQALGEIEPAPAFFVVSGSWPPGVPLSFFDELQALCRARGARLAFDCSGEPLRYAVQKGGICLLKPSLSEMATIIGRVPMAQAEQEMAVTRLIRQRAAEIVLLSLGADGAILGCAEGVWSLKPHRVPVRSTVGAGDSMVGATVLALSRGFSVREAARYGMAAGAATLMSPGTGLCKREDVERLYAEG